MAKTNLKIEIDQNQNNRDVVCRSDFKKIVNSVSSPVPKDVNLKKTFLPQKNIHTVSNAEKTNFISIDAYDNQSNSIGSTQK